MTEPNWIRRDIVLALHARQLAEHGGASGLRDEGLLDSALNAPRQLYHYEEADLVRLAAAYGFSLANNHPFVDGNKRIALAVVDVFLQLNGQSCLQVVQKNTEYFLELLLV